MGVEGTGSVFVLSRRGGRTGKADLVTEEDGTGGLEVTPEIAREYIRVFKFLLCTNFGGRVAGSCCEFCDGFNVPEPVPLLRVRHGAVLGMRVFLLEVALVVCAQ